MTSENYDSAFCDVNSTTENEDESNDTIRTSRINEMLPVSSVSLTEMSTNGDTSSKSSVVDPDELVANDANHVDDTAERVDTVRKSTDRTLREKRTNRLQNSSSFEIIDEQITPSAPLTRSRSGTPISRTLYNDQGMLQDDTLIDVCDCLRDGCVGCHFPCHNCHSTKCGTVCRQNRKWLIDSIVVEGTDTEYVNKYAHLAKRYL